MPQPLVSQVARPSADSLLISLVMQAHENQQPPDHSIVNQMQLLQCAQALVQPGYYGMHMGGMGQGAILPREPSWTCGCLRAAYIV